MSKMKNFLGTTWGRVLLIILFTVLYGGGELFTAMFAADDPASTFGAICGLISGLLTIVYIIFGWLTIRKLFGSWFVIGNISFMIGMFFVKLIFAVLIGIFVTPYRLAELTVKFLELIFGIKREVYNNSES